jgi:hypothetical protein
VLLLAAQLRQTAQVGIQHSAGILLWCMQPRVAVQLWTCPKRVGALPTNWNASYVVKLNGVFISRCQLHIPVACFLLAAAACEPGYGMVSGNCSRCSLGSWSDGTSLAPCQACRDTLYVSCWLHGLGLVCLSVALSHAVASTIARSNTCLSSELLATAACGGLRLYECCDARHLRWMVHALISCPSPNIADTPAAQNQSYATC